MAPKKLQLPLLSTLRPFRSFLFLKLSGTATAENRVSTLRDAIADLVPTLSGAGPATSSARSKKGDLYTAFAVYIRERRAPWTTDDKMTDVEHHLVAVSGYKRWCAVFMSDPGLRHAVRIDMAEEAEAFEEFEPIPTKKLNAVFVKGHAKTLWLNNVQRRTSLKADHKVLSGISLQDALDPLNDQSYTFTAARCQNDVAGQRSTYGIAPRKSRLWFKRSKNWDEYTSTVTTLLRALDESTAEEDAPLPVLSAPVQGAIDPQTLGDAYEMSLLPPELANPADEEETDITDADAVPEFDFEMVDGVVPNLRADVKADNGEYLGRYSFGLHVGPDGRVSWNIQAVADGTPAILIALRNFNNRLNVSFDRGYAISEGLVHSVRYRDLPFAGFTWANFTGADVRKEKPSPLTPQSIGTQDSLFCWIRNGWMNGALGWLPIGGWLASNDGALEVADFIHLQENSNPTLTLIHVKGAKSNAPNRGLAVAPYEIVVSQAVKNLRHVDPQLATTEFMNRLGRQIRNAVWQDGVAALRTDMLAAIQAHGANLARRIVIVQPQTRRQAHAIALGSPEGSRERHLVRQLNALLLGAQQNCSAVGAQFIAVGHDA